MNFPNSWKEVPVRSSRWLERTLSKKDGLVNISNTAALILFPMPLISPHPALSPGRGEGKSEDGALFPLTAWKLKGKYCINE
jgi:hypothetical protein